MLRDQVVKPPADNDQHADQEYETLRCIVVPTVRLQINSTLEVTTMFHARQLIQSALVAATVAAAAPVHADVSFATGGYARIVPESAVVASARSATSVAISAPSFATGGYARVVGETGATSIAEPSPTTPKSAPSFATGGYARGVVADASGVAVGRIVLAGDPWKGGVMGDYQGG
jgi:hypothetical protein